VGQYGQFVGDLRQKSKHSADMSSNKACSYRDLIKANDLITKNFFAENSVAIVTETKGGDFSFKSTVSRDGDKALGVVEPKYEWKDKNLLFEGKVSSANALSIKGTSKDFFTSGLNVSLGADRFVEVKKKEDKQKDVIQGVGSVQFNNEHAHVLVEAKLPVRCEAPANISVAGHIKPIDHIDVGVKLDWTEGKGVKVEGKLAGGTDSVEGAGSYLYPTGLWSLNFWNSFSSSFQWAASLTVPPADAQDKPEPVFSVAGNYKVDDNTSVKTKLSAIIDRKDSKEGHVYRSGLSLQQKVGANTTITVGADVNLNNALFVGKHAVGDPSSCGFQISFK